MSWQLPAARYRKETLGSENRTAVAEYGNARLSPEHEAKILNALLNHQTERALRTEGTELRTILFRPR